MRFRQWSLSTRILLLSAVGVILLAVLSAVFVALFLTVTTPVIYTTVVPIAGPIGALPLVLFAIAFGFKPRPRTWAAVVGVLYGALVLTGMTLVFLTQGPAPSPPAGEPITFEPDALDLVLITMPGALAILAAGIFALARRPTSNATSGRALLAG